MSLVKRLPTNDERCAAMLHRYFGKFGEAERGTARTRHAYRSFINDFEQLKATYPGIGRKTYGVALARFATGGNKYFVRAIWEDMLRSKVIPTCRLYNEYLRCCMMSGDVKEAFLMVKQMRKLNVEPNQHTYHALIGMFCKRGDLANGYRVYRSMSRAGFSPTCRTLSLLLTGCRSYKQASYLVRRFRSKGVKPDTHVYINTISSCMHAGEWDEARKTFKQAMQDGSVTVDHRLWVALIAVAHGAGSYEKLKDTVEAMQEAGFTPCVKVHSFIISVCVLHTKEKDDYHYKVAKGSYEICLTTGIEEIPIVTNWIRVLAKHGLVDEIEEVRTYLRKVLKKGETVNLFNAVKQGYANAGYSPEEVAKLQPFAKEGTNDSVFYANAGVPFHHKPRAALDDIERRHGVSERSGWLPPPRRAV
eukprot:TRINITY_DN2341_c1_g1_i1.p1 TRINITY_DN2341_c1_g1~~TRINITY_DN2341_c1_g1_i1.p1  ORF type:complete len:435 (+),score=101.30 TRINITY_DN2341_c1_g1_i1:54-1307(+)